MKKLIALVILALWGTFSYADFANTGMSAPPTPIATTSVAGKVKPDGTTITVDDNGVITSTASGTGTVTGPATAVENNMATWGADNATLKDSGVAVPNQALSTTSSPTFAGITVGSVTSNAPDNTHKSNDWNTGTNGSATTTGDQWGQGNDNTYRTRWPSGDNTVSAKEFNTWEWAVDQPATTDNGVIRRGGPNGFRQAWKITGLYITVQDNTGKLSTAATDNVTGNIGICDNTASTYAECTKVSTSDWTATGATDLSATIDNATVAVGKVLKQFFSAANMAGKKAEFAIEYKEQ